MIRAVLFDFGGVLTTSPFEAFAEFERERGLPHGFIRSVNATNPDSNAWATLERAEIDIDEFGDAFLRESGELGHPVDGREVLALLLGRIRPAMVEALRRCSKALKTGLLTNNFVSFSGAAGSMAVANSTDNPNPPDEMAAILELFDVVVESSGVGARKPDPHFYEIACDLLEIDPHEAVFLDDLGINLKPARAMGMTTIKVNDPDEAIAELETIVGFALR